MNTIIQQLSEKLISQQLTMATAESCTGGLIAARLTDVAGSSQWFECGIVTYSNASKHTLLDVDERVLEQFGAVSEPVVIQMVEGLLARTDANVGVSVSGIAGPGGGTELKPVGTVFFGWAGNNFSTCVERKQFDGDRNQVRCRAVEYAIKRLHELL